MMYDGVITKPPLEEVIEHGWLQKAHKYIDKYLKNGKWIYRYKSKAQELGAKANRAIRGIDPETPTRNGYTLGDNDGRQSSRSGRQPLKYQNPKDRKARFDAGIEAGRKRAAKKGYAVKGYRGKTGSNLSSRGYSTAETTPTFTRYGTYNKSRKRLATRREMEYYLNNYGKNMDTITMRPVGNIYNRQGSNVEVGTKAGRKRVAKKRR